MKITLQPMQKTVVAFYFLISVFLLSSCAEVKDFEFRRIEDWKLNGLGLSSGSISARLLFFNPNHFTVTLKHLEGNVAVEGKDLGYCISDTFVRIPAEQAFLLPVNIELKTGAALLGGLAFLGKDSIMVKFNGYMRAGRGGIFINYKFDSESKVATKF